jgi:pimeloyl-ACP methyl ester carboxylesterase
MKHGDVANCAILRQERPVGREFGLCALLRHGSRLRDSAKFPCERPARRRVACGLLVGALLVGVTISGCAGPRRTPPIRELYSDAAQGIGAERDPVVVIPGILGSRLIEPKSGQIVWGAFTYGAADADFADGARLVALPMREGASLRELQDEVQPDGVLESLDANVSPLLRITAIEPYRGIIEALAAGRFVDRDIARSRAGRDRSGEEIGAGMRARMHAGSGEVDYAGLHYTCFQFDYDWRRDISESAARLDELIRAAAEVTQAARGTNESVKVDVVAHSMGGMVLHYYLRYGAQPLPEDGSLPTLTWAGAQRVGQAILVGTPSAGSVISLKHLVDGVQYSVIAPEFRPALLGSMPALYQLLPRDRHKRVLNKKTGEPIESLYDLRTWEKYNWGLANPEQDRVLAWLLPDVPDAASRRRIALDHLEKCLKRAEQLHRALDVPMVGADEPPADCSISIVLGDTERTPALLEVDPRSGQLRVKDTAPGDGTVTRASALMDERLGDDAEYTPRLRSPIRWTRVQFVPADHLELTEHPAFVNGLLYELLEKPRSK